VHHDPLLKGLISLQVLLVEADPDDAMLLAVFLEELPDSPFELRRAKSLAEALELITRHQPQVVLLNLDLPDAKDLHGVAAIRAAAPQVPIVVLTRSDDDRLAIEAVRAGAQDFLVWGRVDSWGLGRTLRHSLERHRLMEELEEARRQERHRATHDPLTSLPNRALYFDRLGHAIAQSMRRREQIAVVYLDLDGFKPVNDQHGHMTGDQVLVQIAERLSQVVRRSDTLARLGGDEFGVLFERVPDRATALALMEGLQTALRDPILVGPHRCQLSLSAGLALYPDDGSDADALISFADEQMYLQKLGLRPSDDRMLRIV
jgi:diguanylate cyclase (GGDEF)-like protein